MHLFSRSVINFLNMRSSNDAWKRTAHGFGATTILWTAFAMCAPAQDVASSKPVSESPSLEATMKFIQDKLSGQGRIQYDYVYREALTTARTREFAAVVADPKTCAMSFSIHATGVSSVTTSDSDQQIQFSLKDVDKIKLTSEGARAAGYNYYYNPDVYLLSLEMLPGKTIQSQFRLTKRHPATQDKVGKPQKGKKTVSPAIEEEHYDQQLKDVDLPFRDQEMSQRVANAMQHAVKLCGGGNKDPF
jgi:hypothetical protein